MYPLRRRFHDLPDQFNVVHADGCGQHGQVGMLRMQPGQWISFQKLRLPAGIGRQVNSAAIATVQLFPGGQADPPPSPHANPAYPPVLVPAPPQTRRR